MDAGYYERKADGERKRADEQTRKRGDYEKQAADYEARAARDEEAAAKATSDGTRRSKVDSAKRHRLKVADLRKKAGAATIAAGKHIEAANKADKDARTQRSREARKAADKAKRDAREDQRRADRERRARDARDREMSSRLGDLQVRTADLAAAIEESRRAAPTKITALLMAGTPAGGTASLRLDQEAREIDQKVRASAYRDHIALEWTQATRVSDVIDALNRYQPDIVHFSGHGDSASLLFEGPDGGPVPLRGEHLALLLQAAPRPIRLVVFNACESAEQALAATDWCDFGIGMERPIGDDAAKEWAGQFYGSLASGVTLAVAFKQATAQATVLTSTAAAGNPQLFEGRDADAEATVLVAPGSAL